MPRVIPVLLLLALPSLLDAGLVQTASARLEGKVVFAGDHVTVDGKKVAWTTVLSVIPDEPGKALPQPNRVHFKNGETWSVEVLKLVEGKLTVRSDLFGEKTLALAGLAAIDFVPRPGAQAGRQANTLYRAKGEPIPGALLGIDGQKLRIDSVLGELNLPRDGLLSYSFTNQQPGFGKGFDEVALIDGTLLRGRLTLEADQLKLEHTLLGTLALKTRTVRSIVRRPVGVVDLTELTPQAVRTLPLLGTAENQAARFQVIRGDGQERRAGLFVKGLQLEPKTLVRFKLPATEAKTVWLRTRLLPVAGARGDVRLTMKAGPKKWEHALTTSGAPVEVSLELPAGMDLELEVDFGEALRFPCGIVLADPHVLLEKP